MDWAQYYADLTAAARAGERLALLPDLFRQFYQAFIEGERWKLYLKGLGSTYQLTVIALLIGVALGVVVAVIRTAHDQQRPGHHNLLLGIVDRLCRAYITIIRGTPMMVQLLIWSGVVFASSRNHTMVGAFGIGINSGAYVAEIVRGGLMSVDMGQSEAGRSLGLNYLDTMRLIVIPQAFKNIVPSLANEFITLFKDTSLVTAIGGAEMLYYAKAIGAKTYGVMFPLLGAACIYLVNVMLLTWLQGKLERRLRQSDRR